MANEARVVCGRCRRPSSVCYCAHLPSLDTTTRVVLLQHPRERDMPIGTAHMARLCLPNAELHVGVDFIGDRAVSEAVTDPSRPAVLLYPGEGARPVEEQLGAGPLTLVVLDGTWSQARKLLRRNPSLAALPRLAFAPARPSEYRIRREPRADYVSTIEALVHVLGVLEGDAARFLPMMDPFRAMIDAQLACALRAGASGARHKRRAAAPSKPPRLPEALRARAEDVVCLVGEANAFPYRPPSPYPDELVHLLACRLSTGELFEHRIAPASPVAPNTTRYTGLSAEQLAGGTSFGAFDAAWRAFARESDVLCSWGYYPMTLLARAGGYLPPTRLDLRATAGSYFQARAGSIPSFLERAGEPPRPFPPRLGLGRGGLRLAELCRLAACLVALARG